MAKLVLTIDLALHTTDYQLNLFLRQPDKLAGLALPADRVTFFEVSADDKST